MVRSKHLQTFPRNFLIVQILPFSVASSQLSIFAYRIKLVKAMGELRHGKPCGAGGLGWDLRFVRWWWAPVLESMWRHPTIHDRCHHGSFECVLCLYLRYSQAIFENKPKMPAWPFSNKTCSMLTGKPHFGLIYMPFSFTCPIWFTYSCRGTEWSQLNGFIWYSHQLKQHKWFLSSLCIARSLTVYEKVRNLLVNRGLWPFVLLFALHVPRYWVYIGDLSQIAPRYQKEEATKTSAEHAATAAPHLEGCLSNASSCNIACIISYIPYIDMNRAPQISESVWIKETWMFFWMALVCDRIFTNSAYNHGNGFNMQHIYIQELAKNCPRRIPKRLWCCQTHSFLLVAMQMALYCHAAHHLCYQPVLL